MIKIVNKILGIISIPFALIFVVIVRLISPIIIIRWCAIISTRLGHFAENTNIYLSEKQLGKHYIKGKIIFDIFYFYPKICNYQLAKMFKRKILVLPYFFMNNVNYINEFIINKVFKSNLHDIGYYRNEEDLKRIENTNINSLVDGIKKNLLFPPLSPNDSLNAQEQAKINIFFTQREINNGNSILKNFGIDTKKKIVGIILRDNDYLKENYPKIDWSYHKIRHSDFSYYSECAEKLASLGYQVVVFGERQKKFKNKNIINYTNSSIRSDFMDIYLSSKLNFAISSANGLDAIPIIFKIPLIEVSVAPIILIRPYTSKIKILFKTYYSKTLKRKLNMEEIFKFKLHDLQGKDLSDEIEFIHPSSKEITSAALEFHDELSNNFEISEEEKILQNNFKTKYKKLVETSSEDRNLNNFTASIGKLFLKNNSYLVN
tara:strand:- start:1002 stop:2297 length:1296 start_codon:yes stop_codon:yes gene_type:complete